MLKTWVKEWFEGWTVLWRLIVVYFWVWIYSLPLIIFYKLSELIPLDKSQPKIVAAVLLFQASLALFWLPYCLRNGARSSGYVRMPDER